MGVFCLAPESEADNISLRSETSFSVEMENLVSMAELALSENSLEQLASRKQKVAVFDHNVHHVTSFDTADRPLSTASLGDDTANGLLTPKAASPRYLVCSVFRFFVILTILENLECLDVMFWIFEIS